VDGQGCLQWQALGLQPAAAVRQATEAYLAAEDAVSAWIDDKCDRDPNAWTPSADLFASWTEWATAAGEFVGSQKRFSQTLETRGFIQARKRLGQGNPKFGFQGLRTIHDRIPWEAK
jgi:putative DNA primase/helicase